MPQIGFVTKKTFGFGKIIIESKNEESPQQLLTINST